MSHNGPHSGPPWSGGRPEEPYAEPSDPWGENSRALHDPAWDAAPIPHQQYPAQPAWQPSAPPPPPPPPAPERGGRRGIAMGALIAVLSVLLGGGLATTVWYLLGRKDDGGTPAASATTAAAVTVPRPQTSADARFAAKGQCVRNEGTNTEPELRIVTCTTNTFEVLKRIDGRTTGEKDAVAKCGKVPGYTKWYYYDTEYDDVDFVLCLREYPAQ